MELKTNYLGMTLKSPIVVSASPLSENVENIKMMEDAGAAAIVLYSLFEEQIKHEQLELHHYETISRYLSPEAESFYPDLGDYRTGPEDYLKLIADAKKAVDIPIIASLNGTTVSGWVEYAKKMQEAGADAIELNQYQITTRMDQSGDEVEQTYLDVLKAVKSEVSIPVAAKLSPFFSNMANMARRFDDAGADALVLFNRFYQPDIDLDNLETLPRVALSHTGSARLPMRWIAILKGRITCDLAATSGIHSGADVLKMMMVGANVAMLCSALLKNGIDHISKIEKEMVAWMEEKEYESILQMQGSMCQLKNSDPGAFERAQYMKALASFKM